MGENTVSLQANNSERWFNSTILVSLGMCGFPKSSFQGDKYLFQSWPYMKYLAGAVVNTPVAISRSPGVQFPLIMSYY